MDYALVYHLPVQVPALDAFRERYDPRYEVAAPHLTLVFPLRGVDEGTLKDHIRRVTAPWPTFRVRLRGVTTSWDDLVFLLVQEGREELVRLHGALYTGMLAPALRHDLPYEPHLTLGRSVTEETVREAECLDLDISATVDALHLVKRSHEYAAAVVVGVFELARR